MDQIPRFWVEALKNYGTNQKVWTCPTIQRRFREDPSQFSHYPTIHYMPAEFDEKPQTPHRWPTMPWALEIGSMHGGGNLLIRGDGGIREMNELIREAQGAPVYQMK